MFNADIGANAVEHALARFSFDWSDQALTLLPNLLYSSEQDNFKNSIWYTFSRGKQLNSNHRNLVQHFRTFGSFLSILNFYEEFWNLWNFVHQFVFPSLFFLFCFIRIMDDLNTSFVFRKFLNKLYVWVCKANHI